MEVKLLADAAIPVILSSYVARRRLSSGRANFFSKIFDEEHRHRPFGLCRFPAHRSGNYQCLRRRVVTYTLARHGQSPIKKWCMRVPCQASHADYRSSMNAIRNDSGKELATLNGAYEHARKLIHKILFRVGHEDAEAWTVIVLTPQ